MEQKRHGFRPQQGLTIMNIQSLFFQSSVSNLFPSPTGVNYYESVPYRRYKQSQNLQRFRPQQGLTIMNRRQKVIKGN